MVFKISGRHIDEFEWRCMQYACIKYLLTVSIRYGPILSSFRINLKIILKAIYYFSLGLGVTSIIELAQIKKGLLLALEKNYNLKD